MGTVWRFFWGLGVAFLFGEGMRGGGKGGCGRVRK